MPPHAPALDDKHRPLVAAAEEAPDRDLQRLRRFARSRCGPRPDSRRRARLPRSASAKSMITLTRCSSTPSADTFMKPGRLDPPDAACERLAAAPLLDPDGVARRDADGVGRQQIGDDLQACADRRSRAAARRPARPTALSRSRFSTTPSTGATTSTVRPPGLDGLQPGPRELELVLGPAPPRTRAAAHAFLRTLHHRLRRLRARRARWRRRRPGAASRRRLDCARAERRPPRARARPAPVRRPHARHRPRRPAPTCTRGSSSGAAAGVRRATTVLPRTTRSPGSSSMRSSRPMTGADTTKRSRTRVSPSSSIVTCIGPRSTRPRRPRSRSARARRPEWRATSGDPGQ